MSLGTILVIILIIFLLGGFSGRFGGYGYGYGHGGVGIIGVILIVQLAAVARRLLREGYAFDDIRAALLAEAKVQEEEADAVRQGRFWRRLDSLWHRVWAGRVGRWFFRMAWVGRRRGLPWRDEGRRSSRKKAQKAQSRESVCQFGAFSRPS